MLSSTTRWSVIWLSKKQKCLVETEFEDDLGGALKLYRKALSLDAPMLTLRSMNTGWAPPPKLRPRQVTKVKRVGRKKVKETHTVTPMQALNLKGIWWCPYCIQLRKFKKLDYVTMNDGTVVDIPGYYCPICGISHRNGHVQKWNPAHVQAEASLHTRRPRGTRSNRSSRRRSRNGKTRR